MTDALKIHKLRSTNKITNKLYNAWSYSPLGVVLSSPSEYLWITPNCWSPQCVKAPPPNERSWTNHRIIIDAGRNNSYVLSFEITEPNFTKVLRDVEKWLHINLLELKLRYSNSFRNASVPNKGRSSNCGRVAALCTLLNSEVSGQMFTKCLHDV